MKFINKSDVEKTTLSNYEGRFVRMEVYLRDGRRMLVHNEDGTLKKYDEDEHQEVEADADKVFAHYGDRCIAVTLIEIEREECFKDEERWVTSIEENKITEFNNPLYICWK